jgi:hypothetical protein
MVYKINDITTITLCFYISLILLLLNLSVINKANFITKTCFVISDPQNNVSYATCWYIYHLSTYHI